MALAARFSLPLSAPPWEAVMLLNMLPMRRPAEMAGLVACACTNPIYQ